MKKKIQILVALLLVGGWLSGGIAYAAEVIYEVVADLSSAPGDVLSATSTADSASAATAARPRKIRGASSIVVNPTFSVAGAQAVIEVWGYFREPGTSTQSAPVLLLSQNVTASLTCTADGTRYVASDGYLLAPTLGCQIYDVRLRKIGSSDGNVKWSSWTLGPQSVPAGSTNE